ncbi:sperm-tail PG-rich repeat containing 2 [Nesidiocoris tenuis]|uniref:Sperm-tail PG-rich repeat containing 2 n=1 Tax=Nesidiocoris tenuis TaxID=355587 RepID=A0ABN7B5M2_9HEMI|nr:sperm-tail PG-rich repeat containing 2 [Nesidiocoris tenuis]
MGSHIKTYAEMKNSYYWVQESEKPKFCKGRPNKCMGDGSSSSVVIKDLNLKRFYKKHYKFPGCKGCAKYQGPTWSMYRATRFRSIQKEGPGPAAYDVNGPGISSYAKWLEKIRFYKNATARVNRFTEIIECEELCKDGPSPADTAVSPDIWKKKSFNVKGTFGNPPAKKTQNSPPAVQSFFKECPKPEREIRRRKRPPFNSTSSYKERANDYPGPGDYNPPQGTIGFKLCKKLPSVHAKFVAPFGATAIQRPLMVDKEIPDPAAYDLFEKPKLIPYGVDVSTFTSRETAVKRVTANENSKMYHTAKAYDSLTKRRDHCKNSKPFNSTGPRLAPLSISDPKAPAPSSYNVDDAAVRTKSSWAVDMSLMSDKRSDKINDTPGPGSYDVHPLYGDALVKAHCSHNITLGPCSDYYPIRPCYGPPLPKTILKTFVKGAK